jgi:PBP1b-binding outer membrane lipoprotein LpoB
VKKFDLTPEQNEQGKKAAIKIVLLLGVIIFFVIKCSCGTDEKDEKIDKTKKYEKMDALVQAQVHIESKLKSPSTAEFGGGVDGVIQTNDTTFTVIGTVDSQNSFGAMMRSNYSCKVIFHPKTDTHDIENVLIQ